MKTFTALTLSAAVLGASALMLPAPSAQAAPVGASVGVLEAGSPVVEQVAMRRRVVRRRNNDGALAAGLIGAAIVGGAIIAQSQRGHDYERSYYYGQPVYPQGQYYDPNGYYYDQLPPKTYYQQGYHYPVYEDGYHRTHRHFPRNPVRDPAGGGVMR